MPETLVDFLKFLNGENNPSPCVGATHHSPTPLTVRWVDVYPGGPEVRFCPTCAENYRQMWGLIQDHHGNPPWTAYRRFGSRLRRIGARSWAAYTSQLMALAES